ncbi:aminoglycoside N(3)-acetyltransferase [Corallincola holothuriorum]|uniref:Aminoglycoside N(3)-acetyltransferase n=1 Tax=Corallincola holothuriorum TaxID=2282215 RepID=A0A368N1A1_9GAMM|nr:AAC(3) family N-acetyltransferase [Corallincola holothuriorum]RCU43291.1 aminoglycoside N(3)-acetyltransferase [Corallincola holothuriorum]
MANDSLIKKMFSLSPHIEMIARRIYWKNVSWLSKRVKKSRASQNELTPVDFCKIKNFLLSNGVDEGGLLVVHSSYSPFKGRGKTANQIVDMLVEMVGDTGTVAMPAMPKFKNSVKVEDYLVKNRDNTVYEYDVQKSSIKTGVLPLLLHKRDKSIRSRHPINSMVAMGPLAEVLMRENLTGDSPLACGVNSSWNCCVEHDAVIVGLGTDLTHSLTMIHVAEDILDERWPIKHWYIEKTFVIKDRDFEEKRTLRERAPHWGALHFGERTLCSDLIKAGLLKTTIIDGITVEVIKSKDLIEFLNRNNANGYPYFWLKNEIS